MGRKLTYAILIGTLGLVFIGIALIADKLGLDPSAGWGRRRIALLIFGIFITLCAILFGRYTEQTLDRMRKIKSYIENNPIVAGIRGNNSLVYLSGLIKKYWFTLPLSVLVILIYIWFISSGTWTTWVSPTHLYADLARGFLKGHLYLPIKVSPNLLTSPDPYDVSIGLGLQGPLDVTYFQGKYYLYWGPVPALVLVLIHPIISWRLGDLQLLFGFITGTFLFECLLTVIVWDRFFNNLPKYMLGLSILLVGLAGPATYLMDSSRGARIYEAAVAGGQFFLVSGIIFALFALGNPISRWKLAIAGTLWALAIGTRLILALPVAFMSLMVAWWIMRTNHWSFIKITDLIPLGIPLALGFVCLGWYNWARFGSVTEVGFYYTITAIPHFQKYYSGFFNPIFIPENISNYFLYPFSVRSQFPYFFSEYGYQQAILPFYNLPVFYFCQKITGLVYTYPFMIFATIPPVAIINNYFHRKTNQSSTDNEDSRAMNWIMLTLSGSYLVTFAIIFSYFWAATRYMEDVMPSLMIISIIGFLQGYKALSQRPGWRRLYTSIGLILASGSILISTMVGLSINDARFVIINLLSAAK